MLVRAALTVGGACALSASIIGAMNLAGFCLTAATRTHKVTDLIGTGAFVVSTSVVALRCSRLKGGVPPVPALLVGCVGLWGVRLAGYLFYRILVTQHDARLAAFFPAAGEGWLDKSGANFPLNLAGFWTIQALWAFVVLLPVTVALASPVTAQLRLSGWHVVSAGAFLVGFLCEAVADYQKFVFKSDPQNKGVPLATGLGLWIESGVWALSRHPNYFGEMVVWAAMYALALPSFTRALHHCTVVSPLFVSALLLFVSGVPLLEKEYDQRYGCNPAYQRYKQRTNLLVPWWPHSRATL